MKKRVFLGLVAAFLSQATLAHFADVVVRGEGLQGVENAAGAICFDQAGRKFTRPLNNKLLFVDGFIFDVNKEIERSVAADNSIDDAPGYRVEQMSGLSRSHGDCWLVFNAGNDFQEIAFYWFLVEALEHNSDVLGWGPSDVSDLQELLDRFNPPGFFINRLFAFGVTDYAKPGSVLLDNSLGQAQAAVENAATDHRKNYGRQRENKIYLSDVFQWLLNLELINWVGLLMWLFSIWLLTQSTAGISERGLRWWQKRKFNTPSYALLWVLGLCLFFDLIALHP